MGTSMSFGSHSGPQRPVNGRQLDRPRPIDQEAPIDQVAIGSLIPIGALMRSTLVLDGSWTGHGQQTRMHIGDDAAELEAGFSHSLASILAIAHERVAFYIGNSENPRRRWAEHAVSGHWAEMEVLVSAPSSRGTGELEQRLIARFSHHFVCTNADNRKNWLAPPPLCGRLG